MASLPPYSTYRTDAKQMMFPQAISHGNVLSFVPPGFKQELNVKFPDSRLAVCEKCKKNFKTRDMCRVRNTHTTAPWTTAYICITIDDSCLDEEGKYVDKPMTVRMVQWQPYCVKKPFASKTPVCAACKRTNRTRSFCRERHKHRHLPWCTVYVLLSTLESADPSTVVAAPSVKVGSTPAAAAEGDENTTNGGDDAAATAAVAAIAAASSGEASTTTTGAVTAEDDAASATKGKSGDDDNNGDDNQDSKPISSAAAVAEDRTESETIASDEGDEGDDINDIPPSRTFLVKVSCRSTSIHWLELDNFEAPDAAAFPGGVAPDAAAAAHFHPGLAAAGSPGMDPSHAAAAAAAAAAGPYYGHTMGYAAQQHQSQLQSRQQYFFQMQQHQQQQFAPQQWQQHAAAAAATYGQAPAAVGQGEQHHPKQLAAGATAGEAAAAQQRRGLEEMQQAQPPPQWAMYYQPVAAAAAQGAYAPQQQQQPTPGEQAAAAAAAAVADAESGVPADGQGDPYQPQTEQPETGDVEEPDVKRQRV